MDFDIDPDAEETALLFRGFFSKESTPEIVRAAVNGFDPALWEKLKRLDVPELAVGPTAGGATFVQLSLIAEEYGRTLAPIPLIEAMCAARAVAASATGDVLRSRENRLLSVISGDLIGAVAMHPVDTSPVQWIPGGSVADVVIVRTRTQVALAWRPDHHCETYRSVHGNTPLGRWTFDFEKLQPLGPPDELTEPPDFVDHWQILTAAALVGLSHRALEIAAEYVSERQVFGTTIGSFQGVAHPLADSVTATEGAGLLVRRACQAVDADHRSDAHELALMAFAFAAGASRNTARRTAHVHGGYGASPEVDIYLYHARALAWSSLLGTPRSAFADIGRALWQNSIRSDDAL